MEGTNAVAKDYLDMNIEELRKMVEKLRSDNGLLEDCIISLRQEKAELQSKLDTVKGIAKLL